MSDQSILFENIILDLDNTVSMKRFSGNSVFSITRDESFMVLFVPTLNIMFVGERFISSIVVLQKKS